MKKVKRLQICGPNSNLLLCQKPWSLIVVGFFQGPISLVFYSKFYYKNHKEIIGHCNFLKFLGLMHDRPIQNKKQTPPNRRMTLRKISVPHITFMLFLIFIINSNAVGFLGSRIFKIIIVFSSSYVFFFMKNVSNELVIHSKKN